jgi:putative MATE family efflux protein
MGISVGANVVMSMAYGAKDEARQQRVVHTAMATAVLSGIIVLVLGLTLSRTILVAIDTPTEILNYSVIYMQIYFLGAPAMMIYNFGAAILRSIGETKKPLLYLFVAGIVNLVINIITVLFLHWHVIGVALGTTVSQCVSAVWVVIDLRKTQGGAHYSIKNTRFHKKELKKILGIGIPMGLGSSMFTISNLLIQSSINAFGEMAIAGNTVAVNIEAFGDSFPVAIENAAVTFVGQNVGAKKTERIPRILGACLFACTVIPLFFAGVFFLLGKYLCMAFNPDPVVIDWALKRIFIVGAFYAFAAPMRGFGAALKGMGHSVSPMLVSLFFTCIARVLYVLFIYANFAEKIIEYIYIIYPITWVLTGIFLIFVFLFVWSREKKNFKKDE